MTTVQSFDSMTQLQAGIPSTTIPKITKIQFYESEILETCAGFQLVYHDYTANTFVYFDPETNICETTTIDIGANQYLADIEVAEDITDTGKESIRVKFVLNDGSEFECGTPTPLLFRDWSSIVP